jgi:hypothetical protein
MKGLSNNRLQATRMKLRAPEPGRWATMKRVTQSEAAFV